MDYVIALSWGVDGALLLYENTPTDNRIKCLSYLLLGYSKPWVRWNAAPNFYAIDHYSVISETFFVGSK